MNPYAAPTSSSLVASRGTEDVIKWIYLACALASSMAIGLGAKLTGIEIRLVAYFIPWGIGLLWLHVTWSRLNTMEREDISPAGAWARCFMPVYGYYWAILVHIILCRDVNEMLERQGASLRVRPVVPVIATVTAIAAPAWLPFALVSYVLWFVYMLRIDAARRTIVGCVG